MLPVNEEIRLSNNNNTIGTVHLITKLSLDTVDNGFQNSQKRIQSFKRFMRILRITEAPYIQKLEHLQCYKLTRSV